MATALVAADRAFVKPLHYDGWAVFPDFVLVDSIGKSISKCGVYAAAKPTKSATARNRPSTTTPGGSCWSGTFPPATATVLGSAHSAHQRGRDVSRRPRRARRGTGR
jgi:hypothetical protein